MGKFLFKKGDIVKVWSLQSFHDGGFINGKEGVVIQDQTGDSVLVSVVRKFEGKDQVDPCYEVYSQQLRIVKRPTNQDNINTFLNWLTTLRK